MRMLDELRPPHVCEQLPVRHDAACAANEAGEEFEFSGCEVHRLPTALHGAHLDVHVEIVERVLDVKGRVRPLLHVPLSLVHGGLRALELVAGQSVFATWEEAELLEVPMTSERGTADAEALGVEPRPMGAVLGTGG